MLMIIVKQFKKSLKRELGETYNIGGNNEITNIQIVETICEILDNKIPLDAGKLYKDKLYMLMIGLVMTLDMLLMPQKSKMRNRLGSLKKVLKLELKKRFVVS